MKKIAVAIILVLLAVLFVLTNINIGINKTYLLKRADAAFFRAYIEKKCDQAFDILSTRAKELATEEMFIAACSHESMPLWSEEKFISAEFFSNTYALVESEVYARGDTEKKFPGPVRLTWIYEGWKWRLDDNLGISGRNDVGEQTFEERSDIVAKTEEQYNQNVKIEVEQNKPKTYNGNYFTWAYPESWKLETAWIADARRMPLEYAYLTSPAITYRDADGEEVSSANTAYLITVKVLSADQFFLDRINRDNEDAVKAAIKNGGLNALWNSYFANYKKDSFDSATHYERFTLNGKSGIIGSEYEFGSMGEMFFLSGGNIITVLMNSTVSRNFQVHSDFWNGIASEPYGLALQGLKIK